MNKYYGECVAKDSLIITNGAGLTTIEEAVKENKSHKIAAINMENQKSELLSISDNYDKGIQKTLKIATPHGFIEVTPTSKLLTLKDLEPTWIFAQDLKPEDRVAIANALPEIKESIPEILNFIDDNVLFSGEWIKDLFNLHGQNKKVAEFLGITPKKVNGHKYNESAPAWIIKRLYKLGIIDRLNLTRKGSIPVKITKDLLYLLGLLSGDGHLRYNYKDKGVSTISLTNADQNIIDEYKRIVKELFEIEDIKPDGNYGYYFSSRPIGNMLKNLGIPIRNKSKTITVPAYIVGLPKKYIASYLQGLFDTDGHVHNVPGGMQISYYTSSKQMLNGVKLLLLRLGIQSTFRFKKDGTYELTVSDRESLNNFKEQISFNNVKRKKSLEVESIVNYSKPVYNRIPLAKFLNKIIEKHNLSKRKLIREGLNPNIEAFSREQVEKFIALLKQLGEDPATIEKIRILKDNDIIWSPIKIIEESENHVYDFTVPKNHNFIANGFVIHNSEKRIRQLFEDAEKNAPSIIFIDEIDAIAPKREDVHGELERRVVAQLLSMMDGLKSRGKVVVIAATNRPNAIDPALRRPGRFDREIPISVPNKKGRLNILKIHTRNMPMSEDVKLEKISELTHGFVGADVSALAKEAAMNVLRRLLPEIKLQEKEPIPKEVLEKLIVTKEDFDEAMKIVRPSAMREILVEIPNVKWSRVGGLESTKQELKEAVEWPLKYPNAFKNLSIKPPRGILLYGPPGCGKTLLAKAIANESQANFILVKGPELLNKFVGESEKGVRKVFEKARQLTPAIIFFDEIDSLVPRRGGYDNSGVTERVVNTLLSELDGLEELNDVIVIAATNRPDMLDPALLRPGRFDRMILVTVPDEKSRLEILNINTKDMPLATDIDLAKLAKETKFYTGADIENVCKEAGILALREDIKAREITMKHFEDALKKTRASVTEEDLEAYKLLEERFFKSAKGAAIRKEVPTYFG
ncbi:AAA family ATPase [Candidatus Woesearchaeota archaeon]|nr:AAA family ATPase [Candidatus Woesearchaeota archaeon]